MERASFSLFAGTVLVSALLTLGGCSSAPKPPEGIYDKHNETARYIDMGAKAAKEGRPEEAARFYGEAYRIATAVDDATDRIISLDGLAALYEPLASRTGASASGAFVFQSDLPADSVSCRALVARIAAESGSPVLAARSSLMEAEAAAAAGTEEGYRTSLTLVEGAVSVFPSKSEERTRALRAVASARKGLGDSSGALAALGDAASRDKKAKRFSEMASDRYLGASIYSKLGDYDAARIFLLEALENDRKSENSPGIGADYRALAMIAEKQGQLPEAVRLYAAARDVFSAARLDGDASDSERRRAAAAEKAEK